MIGSFSKIDMAVEQVVGVVWTALACDDFSDIASKLTVGDLEEKKMGGTRSDLQLDLDKYKWEGGHWQVRWSR